MSVMKKTILDRLSREIEKIKEPTTRAILRQLIKELKDYHKSVRDDMMAIEKRLNDGGL